MRTAVGFYSNRQAELRPEKDLDGGRGRGHPWKHLQEALPAVTVNWCFPALGAGLSTSTLQRLENKSHGVRGLGFGSHIR